MYLISLNLTRERIQNAAPCLQCHPPEPCASVIRNQHLHATFVWYNNVTLPGQGKTFPVKVIQAAVLFPPKCI